MTNAGTLKGKILWVTGPQGLSDAMRFLHRAIFARHKVNESDVVYVSLKGQGGAEDWKRKLADYLKIIQPAVLVVQDEDILPIVGISGSLYINRGSVFHLDIDGHSYPTIVIDAAGSIYGMAQGKWVYTNDIDKIARWYKGTTRRQIRFRYTVIRTLEDLRTLRYKFREALLCATDTETFKTDLNCIGYSFLFASGAVNTFVIPLYDPFKEDQRYWTAAEEIEVWETIAAINDSAVPKICQNGGYDSSYYYRHHVPLVNWYLDTQHMMHSIWCESKKSLNFIASIMLDHYQFWKDEAKDDEDVNKKRKFNVKFRDQDSLERYWRYNALDCYYTICLAKPLLNLLGNLPWARENYRQEFSLQVGPAFAGSMRGLRLDRKRLQQKANKLTAEYERNLKILREMADQPDFTATPAQVGNVLYKVLGAQVPAMSGKKKNLVKNSDGTEKFSTDVNVLKLVAEQHPIYETFIEQVKRTKQPKNNISKYVNLKYWSNGEDNERFMYNLNAGGTETGRFAGKGHNFWIGTNPQNWPSAMRDVIAAEDEYVFFEPDYAQSDARYVAYESQDPKYMENMECGKDTHCLHASWFFKPRTYDEIYGGYKAKDPFYAAEPTGIRYITKRIVHGKNYNMAGFTLYNIMGKAAVVAAALAMGYRDVYKWDTKRLVKFCQSLLDEYDKLYTRLPKWQAEVVAGIIANGNKYTNVYNRTRFFFSDLKTNDAAKREAVANVGQGDTGGNINRVLMELFYSGFDDGSKNIFLTQTHDSMLWALHRSCYHQSAKHILTCMAEPVMIHGRSVVIPPDAKIGLRWGKGLIGYKPDITTIADMLVQEQALVTENENVRKELEKSGYEYSEVA